TTSSSAGRLERHTMTTKDRAGTYYTSEPRTGAAMHFAPPQPRAGFVSDRPESIIEVADVNVYYGGFRAVTGVDLTFGKNEITALIGPSGCGKSTLLRSLNRMNDLIDGARVEGS